jgi:hypothetical protein
MERLLPARHAAIEGGASISLLLVVTDLRAFGGATELENPFYRRSPTTVESISPFCQVRRNAASELTRPPPHGFPI